MDIEQKNLQSYFFDDYVIFLVPASGFGGEMYLIKEDAHGGHETRRVAVEDVEYVLEHADAPFAEALHVHFFANPEATVRDFAENGPEPYAEQVEDLLLDCDDMGIEPPYRTILDWISLSQEDVPAPEVVIPEEWDAYQGEMGIRNL